MSPKFRYLAYVWTQNTAQGQGAQVVIAGNFSYAFSEHFTLGFGINGLPGTRSTGGGTRRRSIGPSTSARRSPSS